MGNTVYDRLIATGFVLSLFLHLINWLRRRAQRNQERRLIGNTVQILYRCGCIDSNPNSEWLMNVVRPASTPQLRLRLHGSCAQCREIQVRAELRDKGETL